jgi:hypothetical protein
MTQTHELLNREKHERLRLGPTTDYRFAATTTLVPIILDEIAVVAREYPIIFPNNATGLPCALTGMRPKSNAYVDDDGRWQADYIPMHIRQQPFALSVIPGAKQEDGKTRYSLAINPAAPEFQNLEGVHVFAPDGQLSPEASAKAELAKRLVGRQGITKAMVKILNEAGILADRSISMKLLDEEPRKVQGFRVVDEKKLNALPDSEFAALRNKGVLPLVYAQLMSMANLHQGVLAGQVGPRVPEQDVNTSKKEGIDLDLYVDDSGEINLFH